MATDRSKWWVFRLPEWLQCMARGHHRLVHVENIYGDEILLLGCRSIWKCEHCGFHFRKANLAAVSGEMPPHPNGVPETANCHAERMGNERCAHFCGAMQCGSHGVHPAPAEHCEWREDDDGIWHTGCGQAFVFDSDGPAENKFLYCYHCGKPLNDAAGVEGGSDAR